MISQLAIDDLKRLRNEGLTPTDADVIRLNALALKVTNGKETTAANAPRIGWAGDTPIYEPTIQAIYWSYEVAARLCDNEQTFDSLYAFACAHGRIPHFFDKLVSPSDVLTAVEKWKSTLTATQAELTRAYLYAVRGDGAEAGEVAAIVEGGGERQKEKSDAENFAAVEEVLQEAARSLNVAPGGLLTETMSRLGRLIYLENIKNGRQLKRLNAREHAEYLATFREIRERLMKEKEQK